MKREILFRAKNVKTGAWERGFIFNKGDEFYIKDSYNDTVSPFLVEEKTIGQYIGLKDAKKQHIFEGDIITSDNVHFHLVEYNQKECSFNVVAYGISAFRIVGNIYENSELLKNIKEKEK